MLLALKESVQDRLMQIEYMNINQISTFKLRILKTDFNVRGFFLKTLKLSTKYLISADFLSIFSSEKKLGFGV